MTRQEKAAWRYLMRVALLWLFGMSMAGSILGVLVTGDMAVAYTFPLALFLFAVVLKGGPKASAFTPEDKADVWERIEKTWDEQDEQEKDRRNGRS